MDQAHGLLHYLLGGLVAVLSLWRAVSPSLDEVLALVPHHTVFSPVAYCPIPFCWNVVTAHFFEAHLLKTVVVVPGIVVLTRLLEKLWTAKAIALHLIFSVASSGLFFFLTELFHVYRTYHERDFFVPVRGCAGLLVALAVGVRHSYPLEALPLLPRTWGLQFQHLPFALASFACILGFLAPESLPDWPFAPPAFFFGWLHLRYLMWFPHAQAHGDHSPDFCFAALFPRVIRPVVGCVGAVVHGLGDLVVPGFVRLRQVDVDAGHSIVYDPAMAMSVLAAYPSVVIPGGPGSKEYEARRAKALALLEESARSSLARDAGRPLAISRDVELGVPPKLMAVPAAMPVAAPALGASLEDSVMRRGAEGDAAKEL